MKIGTIMRYAAAVAIGDRWGWIYLISYVAGIAWALAFS